MEDIVGISKKYMMIGTGDIPTVFHRRNGKGWLVTMRIKDWIKLYGNNLNNDD